MACSKGLNQRLKEDRISQLPESLICQILSHLPSKETVKTSVLSTRWRSLWLCVPSFDLACWQLPKINDFKSFGDKFFDSNRVSCIHEVKLFIGDTGLRKGVDDVPSYLMPWFDAAINRKIQHLDAWFPPCSFKMPLRLYTCETLVSLKLFHVTLDGVEFVSLPCLKTLHLKYMWYRKEANFERLVTCCPVLEELKISGCVNDNAKVFRVLSRSLKKLRIKTDKNDQGFGSGFVIDAPRLCFLRINDKLSESFIITDVDPNAKVDISLSFGLSVIDEASVLSRRSTIRSFLHGISKVRDMTLCRDTFKFICQYSKIELLPQFGYISSLRVTFRVSDVKWLPTFLGRFSNLKSLILVWNTNSKKMYSKELHQFIYSAVQECLLSSLEFVDIKTGISGHAAELQLVMFLLMNSTILKKLTVRLNYYCTDEKHIIKTLLELPRRSTKCKVVIY
ncbi:F-box domain [Arabidopsis suecica]|nr:F-box domain [Arabidopsis suecica]